MADPDYNAGKFPRLVIENDQLRPGPGPLKGGGGGGTSDNMEPRVKALEDKFEKMDAKLDAIGKDLAYLKGKVDSLPTTMQLILFAVAVFAAAGITRFFNH